MGRKAKHSDLTAETVLDVPDHPVSAASWSARRYDPVSEVTSLMADRASGDWSWKPKRNEAFPQFGMPAMKPHRHPLEGIRF